MVWLFGIFRVHVLVVHRNVDRIGEEDVLAADARLVHVRPPRLLSHPPELAIMANSARSRKPAVTMAGRAFREPLAGLQKYAPNFIRRGYQKTFIERNTVNKN